MAEGVHTARCVEAAALAGVPVAEAVQVELGPRAEAASAAFGQPHSTHDSHRLRTRLHLHTARGGEDKSHPLREESTWHKFFGLLEERIIAKTKCIRCAPVGPSHKLCSCCLKSCKLYRFTGKNINRTWKWLNRLR